MKKLLALVLAVMMLGTVALAFDVEIGKGGSRDEDVTYAEPNTAIQLYYNTFAKVKADNSDLEYIPAKAEFTSEYFAISTKKFDKGADLVKSVSFNDKDECVEIKLVEDKTLYTDTTKLVNDPTKYTVVANLVIKEIQVKAKKKDEDAGLKKNAVYTYVGENATFVSANEITVTAADFNFKVGYNYQEAKVLDGDTTAITVAPESFASMNTYNVGAFKKAAYMTYKLKANDGVYEDFEITLVDENNTELAYYEVRGYKNDVLNLYYDNDPDLAIVKKYSDAELTFINLGGKFSAKGEIEVYADEDEFLYELVDGKLVATSLKWDDDAYAYVGKTAEPASYVISDIKLDVASASTTVANPDTGANDVVGIAVALAAVAAVSAAAVSLKK